jgi:hypothetical protein
MMQGNNCSSDISTKKEYTVWVERWIFNIQPVATDSNH